MSIAYEVLKFVGMVGVGLLAVTAIGCLIGPVLVVLCASLLCVEDFVGKVILWFWQHTIPKKLLDFVRCQAQPKHEYRHEEPPPPLSKYIDKRPAPEIHKIFSDPFIKDPEKVSEIVQEIYGQVEDKRVSMN